jgi:hypothetical protein
MRHLECPRGQGPLSLVNTTHLALYPLSERANSPEAISSDEPVAEQTEPSRATEFARYTEQLPVSAAQHVPSSRLNSLGASNDYTPHTPPHPTIWNRIGRRARRGVKSLRLTSAKLTSRNIWNKTGTVAIVVGRDDMTRSTTIKYDPGCEVNVISTRFLRNFDITYTASTGVPFAISITGGETFQSLGEIDIRWYDPSYRMVYEDARCHVVKSEHIELLVGQIDIDRLQLFKPNLGLIGALITRRPKVQGKLGLVTLDVMATVH